MQTGMSDTQASRDDNRTHARVVRLIVGVAVAFLGLVYLTVNGARPDVPERFVNDEPRPVDAFAVESAENLLAAGEKLQRVGRLSEAISAFAEVPDSLGVLTTRARVAEASTLIHIGRLDQAEGVIERLAAVAPEHPRLIQMQASLLTSAGRRWEAREAMRTLVERRIPGMYQTLIDLALLYEMPSPKEEYLAALKESGGANESLCLGRYANSVGLHAKGLEYLSTSMKANPKLVEPYVQFSTALLDLGKIDSFMTWQKAMPVACEEHPQTWFVRGRFFEEQQERSKAIESYAKCFELDPNHDVAAYRLALLLKAAGEASMAKTLIERAELQGKYRELAITLFDDGGSKETLSEIAMLALSLGRMQEAAAWKDVLVRVEGDEATVQKLASAVDAYTPETLPWLEENGELVSLARSRIASGTEPEKMRRPTDVSAASKQTADVRHRFALRDDADEANLGFRFHNRTIPDDDGRRMYEYTGGATCVIDFDLDLAPDIFFTQASEVKTAVSTVAADAELHDTLFRNRNGESFREVAAQAGVDGREYGQGASVGDFNSDGFPDLYVASLSGAKLLTNNGDGTFGDVTDVAGANHDAWTSSCMIADLNNDSHPDLFSATYLTGDDVFTRVCENNSGRKYACNPNGFPPDVDVYYQSRGDGTFAELTEEAGLDATDGDGLGLAVADFDNTGDVEIFVANDERPSFFYQARQKPKADGKRWSENGLFSGLAFNGQGEDQANMGIAVEDIDHNGFQDLFVTNFFQQANTLFLNQDGLSFLDQTKSYGLHDASWAMLGFGTQFIDIDLDGWHDLVVANGHIDDFSFQGTPYRMPTQVFRNVDGERFEEIDPASEEGSALDDYFHQKLLGRSVAVVDWNLDRRDDFVISDLEANAAVVTNVTETPHESVAFRLIGTESNRDAVGSQITVTRGDLAYSRQVKAGDGYQSSNERLLRFGLGATSGPITVAVRWPSGKSETFRDVEVGDFIIVESLGNLRETRPSEVFRQVRGEP